MPSDRPNLDDDQFDWLKGAGDADKGKPGEPEPGAGSESEMPRQQTSAASTSNPTDDDWFGGEASEDEWPEEATPRPATVGPAAGDDWLKALSSSSGAASTYDSATQATSIPPAARPEDMDWMAAFAQETSATAPESAAPATPPAAPSASEQKPSRLQALKKATGELKPVPPPAAPPPAPTGQAAPAAADDLSWLDTALTTPTTPEAPAAKPSESKPLKPLKPLARSAPAPEAPVAPSPTFDADRTQPTSRTQPVPIKRLGQQAQTEPPKEAAPGGAPKPPTKPLKRLPSQDRPPASGTPGAPDLSNMTFEEWERQQNPPEQPVEQVDEAEKLLEEVPDWIAAGTPPPAPGSAPAGAEFMPDWFMGMEERPKGEAPDWFANMDLTSAPLVGPETIQTPPAAPITPPVPAAPAATSAADEVPDWFKGDVGAGELDFNALFAAGVAPAPSPAPIPIPETPVTPAPPAPVPSPLTQPAEDTFGQMAQAPGEPAAVPAEEIPDFLKETAPPAPPAPELPPAAPPKPSGMLSQMPAAPRAETGESNKAGEAPDWMRDITPVPATSVSAPQDTKVEDLDWMADLGELPSMGPAAPQAPTPFAGVGPDADASQIDIDSLLNLPSSGTLETPAPVSETALAPQQEVDLETSDLDLLLGPAEAAAPGRIERLRSGAVPAAPIEPGTESLPAESIPEWVADLKPTGEPIPIRIGDQVVRLEEKPVAPLNEAMRRLRERGKALRALAAQTPAATSGPLAGITNTLAAATDFVQSSTTPAVVKTVISDLQARRVEMVRSLLKLDEATTKHPELDETPEQHADRLTGEAAEIQRKARSRPRLKPDRILITLLLALAIVAPFFTDAANLVSVPDAKGVTPTFESVTRAVGSLQSGQLVLVAFEYGPTAAGELDDLARVVLRDLFQRKARLVIVSTNPAGAMHARAFMSSLSGQLKIVPALAARKDYILLGYVPGGAAGVRTLASALQAPAGEINLNQQLLFKTDIEGQPSGLSDTDIAVLRRAPAFVLTEGPEDVRNWAEQYRPISPVEPTENMHVVLLSSVGASAVAASYVGADPHFVGPLVGLRDAMVYHAVRFPTETAATNADRKRAEQRWQSIGLAGWLAALVILVGAALNMVRDLTRRRRTR